MCACASVHLNEFLLPCFCHGSRCYPGRNESRVIDSDRIRKKKKKKRGGGEQRRPAWKGRNERTKEKEREGSEKEGKTHGSKFVPISCTLLITPVK